MTAVPTSRYTLAEFIPDMSGAKDRILDAAEAIVLRDGVAHLTLDAVAQGVRASQVTVRVEELEDLLLAHAARLSSFDSASRLAAFGLTSQILPT